MQTYLLQFPLRPPWRPYHTDSEGLQNVKLKPKVLREKGGRRVCMCNRSRSVLVAAALCAEEAWIASCSCGLHMNACGHAWNLHGLSVS